MPQQPLPIDTHTPRIQTLKERAGESSHRGAALTICRHCKTPVLRGLDDTMAGFPATADTTPLDTAGELYAILAGRKTYELRSHKVTRLALWRRDRWQIQGRTPGACGPHTAYRYDVVAEHACDAPRPTQTLPSVHLREVVTVGNDTCPF